MRLFHFHFHPRYNWIPHFMINGYKNSLDEEIEAGNIHREYHKREGTEYLIVKGCRVCEDKTFIGLVKM